jgi:hypothetical protein
MVATYDFVQTRDQIIKRALRIVGVLSDGDTPTTDQVNNAADALNAMVKRWQNDHIFLWTLVDVTQSASAGTASYSLSSSNLVSLHGAFIRDASNNDTPLVQIKYTEYLEIYNKTDRGEPDRFAWDYQLSGKIYLYPTPDATYSVHVIGVKLLADFDASGDSPDAAARWIDALVYGLSDSLADEYLLPGAERQYIHGKAETYKQLAKTGDRQISETEFSSGAY